MSVSLPLYTAPLLLQAAQPTTLSADLDGDGVVEVVTVDFSPLREIRVTVSEPGGGASTLNLGAFPDHSGVQEEAVVSLLGVDDAGVPLLRVQASSTELCSAWEHDIFISYTGAEPLIAFESIRAPDAPASDVVFSPGDRSLVSGDARHTFVDGVYVLTD